MDYALGKLASKSCTRKLSTALFLDSCLHPATVSKALKKVRRPMASRYSWLALAVLAAFLVGLTSCQHVRAAQPVTQYISLNYNNGSCQQNGSSGVIDIVQNQPVVFKGTTSLNQFQAQFTTCPFSSCPVNSPNGSPVNMGPQPEQWVLPTTTAVLPLTINHATVRVLWDCALRAPHKAHGPVTSERNPGFCCRLAKSGLSRMTLRE
jgi:hypothetical protein